MARLPTKDDLSGRASLRSGRAIASADTSAIGRGLQSFGNSVQQVGADVVQQQNTVDLARAEAYKTEQLMAAENDFAYDPDYSTVGTRASERTGKIVSTGAELIRDPSLRQRWAIGAGTDAARVNDSISDRGVVLQRQAETSAFDEALEANRRLYVDPATPEAVRQKARVDIEGAIQMGQGSGLLTPGDAAVRTTKYLEDADYSRGLLAVDSNEFTGAVPSGDAPALLRQFEGFRKTPYWDVNAYRVGYGSDTITKADGSVVKVTQGMTVTRDDAERDLARRTQEFENRAITQVGPDAWAAMPAPARAALTSVAYNYGSLPASVVGAIKGGDVNAVASAVSSLDANKDRRGKEAAIIAGKANPDWYTRLSPEQQQVINDRTVSRQQAAQTAAKAQETIAYTQHKDATALGILTGSVVSEQEIIGDTVLDDGDKTTLLRSLRTEQDASSGARTYLAGLGAGTAPSLNPFSTDDQALTDKSFEMLMGALPAEQHPAATVQFVTESGMVPKAVVADVRRNLASNDPAVVAPGLQQAATLAKTVPTALSAVPNGGDIRKAADLFDTYSEMGYTPDEAAQRLIASNDPQAVRDREALLKSKPVVDMLKAVTSNDVAGIFGWNTAVGENPAQGAAMVSEYKSMLEESLVDANGDQSAAKQLAATKFQRVYGKSALALAGSGVVTRLPPEKAYPALPDGSFGYIDTQLREVLKSEGVDFDDARLAAYDATDTDFKNGQPARYQVSYLKDGQWQMFNLPFVADYQAGLAGYNDDRAKQVGDARLRQQVNAGAVIENDQGQPANGREMTNMLMQQLYGGSDAVSP